MADGKLDENLQKALTVVRFYLMQELGKLDAASYSFQKKKDKEAAERVVKRAYDVSALMQAIGRFTLEVTKS